MPRLGGLDAQRLQVLALDLVQGAIVPQGIDGVVDGLEQFVVALATVGPRPLPCAPFQ